MKKPSKEYIEEMQRLFKDEEFKKLPVHEQLIKMLEIANKY